MSDGNQDLSTPSVPTVAHLAAIHTDERADGTLFSITTTGQVFMLVKDANNPNADAPANGTSIIAGFGGGRFVELVGASQVNAQDVWYIDATNGNDTWDGSAATNTPGTLVGPIATYAELTRRFGGAFTFENRTVIVNVIGDSTERVEIRASLPPSSTLNFIGVRTTLRSSALDAVTAYAAAGPTLGTIDDAGVADWSPYYGKQLQVTIGGQPAYGWISGILGVAAGPVRFSPLVQSRVPAVPAPGDAYVVSDLPTMSGSWLIDTSGPGGTIGGGNVNFQFLEFTGLMRISGGASFLACQMGNTDNQGSFNIYEACKGLGAAFTVQMRSATDMYGCYLTGASQVVIELNSVLEVGALSLFEDVSLFVRSGGNVRTAGANGAIVWDAESDPIVLDPGAILRTEAGRSFGEDMTGTGIVVRSGAFYSYATGSLPNFAGGGTYSNVGGSATAVGALPVVNATNNAMIVVTAP